MAHSALTPVFVGLRTGLHVLFLSLAALVIARAVFAPAESGFVVIVVSLVVVVTYAVGGIVARSARSPRGRSLKLIWLGTLTVEWVVLLWLSADAAYLVFPLFFLHLHLLGRWWGSAAILTSAVVAICALGIHGGWSVGGVVGPLVGAAVALLIGLGYQALASEAERREALMTELLSTRDLLAATEHEAGVLAERARLAREIHDTVAQGLSSIQLLLHAAERIDIERPGLDHIRLARDTAAASLADTRRFIRELTPPQLDDHGLGGALRRLAATEWEPHGLEVDVRVSDAVAIPMHLQTALLRIAQGAVANVIQHAHASTVTITLEIDNTDLHFTVVDDGAGFDRALALKDSSEKSDSFGLRATQERVDQLAGTMTVDTAPGHGTALTVDIRMPEIA
jgi:signal transduction histidine kinase